MKMLRNPWVPHIKGKKLAVLAIMVVSVLMEIRLLPVSSGGMFLTDSKEDAEKVRKWSTQAGK